MSKATAAIRYAVRQLLAARVFTIAAVLTLALGIGGTTAIFTLIHAVMLKSLPVADPASLYRIGDSDTRCVQADRKAPGHVLALRCSRKPGRTPEFVSGGVSGRQPG